MATMGFTVEHQLKDKEYGIKWRLQFLGRLKLEAEEIIRFMGNEDQRLNLDSAEKVAQAQAETVTNSPSKFDLMKKTSPRQPAQGTVKKQAAAAEAFKTHKSHQ